MGEMTSKTEATAPVRRLHWTVAGLTNKEADAGPQFAVGDRVYPRSGGEVYTVERVAVIEGGAGRQQFWAIGNAIPRHSDEYQLVKPK